MEFNRFFLASTLGNDPHTEGIHNAMHIAKLAGIDGLCLPPSDSLDLLCDSIKKYSPLYIGLSYRLTPTVGVDLLTKTINYFVSSGLISKYDSVEISFSGLPDTISQLRPLTKDLPLKVNLVPELPDIMDRAINTLDYFGGGHDREAIIKYLREELVPKGFALLDQLADEVISHDDYKNEPPLPIPSDRAVNDFIQRINESQIPLLRSHFGIPDNTIYPTVDGIAEIAEARVIDELSLGSSDLSQRYFGQPEMFEQLKNDGGVPYRDEDDLKLIYNATRRGNFPSIKPYCHVKGIVEFIRTCLKLGLLKGAHQAIPLFWFNELDGRGPHNIAESIYEHFDGVRELVRQGIPVEMNDPNQWSSRKAHDTIITTSYALISSVMTMCGVNDMIVQMQFNKPKETGDYADLAKMRAGLRLMKELSTYRQTIPHIHIETRTGIESLSPDMNKAKWQLGRSTLLQMCMNPDIIHVVSYCEANYAARPADIIDSSRLIRRAVRLFNENKPDILALTTNSIISEREEYLYNQSKYLLQAIAYKNGFKEVENLRELTPLLGNPESIIYAISSGIMSAPGIINERYKGCFITKPMKYGMINLVDDYINPIVVSERDRIKSLVK